MPVVGPADMHPAGHALRKPRFTPPPDLLPKVRADIIQPPLSVLLGVFQVLVRFALCLRTGMER